ncbi:hypothetical protein ES703_116962 [subsurface metagenome]
MLKELPKFYNTKAMIGGKERRILHDPISATEFGYERVFRAGKLPPSLRIHELGQAGNEFIKALKADPHHVNAFVGIGLVISFLSGNALEMVEWFAKAYSLDDTYTITRLIDLRFIGIIQNIYKAISQHM